MKILNPFHPAISYNKKTRTFSAEISSLGDCGRVDSSVTFFNQKTGNSVVLKHHKTDKDSSGEDIYGWRYKGIGIDGKEFYFLLIND